MQAKGRVVSHDVILNRLALDGESERSMVSVLLSQARSALRRLGATIQFENVHGQGYRWNRGFIRKGGQVNQPAAVPITPEELTCTLSRLPSLF